MVKSDRLASIKQPIGFSFSGAHIAVSSSRARPLFGDAVNVQGFGPAD